ncbi:uncharacterized protein LOC123034925 [Varanus komodoensis]|uniref:uncharacterized protein LOC123034925 n=1 Tax=Varanus komodoensis TaxID=61221 RepID=UPI001CF7B0FE|nr:uncharacterized protein LOC123034925 [Varanus komodoensis]
MAGRGVVCPAGSLRPEWRERAFSFSWSGQWAPASPPGEPPQQRTTGLWRPSGSVGQLRANTAPARLRKGAPAVCRGGWSSETWLDILLLLSVTVTTRKKRRLVGAAAVLAPKPRGLVANTVKTSPSILQHRTGAQQCTDLAVRNQFFPGARAKPQGKQWRTMPQGAPAPSHFRKLECAPSGRASCVCVRPARRVALEGAEAGGRCARSLASGASLQFPARSRQRVALETSRPPRPALLARPVSAA